MHARRLLEAALALVDNRRIRLAAQILLLATIVFVVIRLRSVWHDNTIDPARIRWAALAGAVVLTAAGTVATGLIWIAILRRLGVDARRRSVAVFFQAQLAKYIPGAVWQYAGRAALAQSRGIPIRPVALSLPVELAASLWAAVAVAPLVLGDRGIAGALALVGATAAAARLLRSSATAAASLPYIGVWLAIGSGFWLTARALVGAPARELLVYVGAYTAAWVVGLLAVYAPGGIGVREAVLVALLRGRLGSADALVVATAFRALQTLVDVGVAGVTAMAFRHRPLLPQRET